MFSPVYAESTNFDLILYCCYCYVLFVIVFIKTLAMGPDITLSEFHHTILILHLIIRTRY